MGRGIRLFVSIYCITEATAIYSRTENHTRWKVVQTSHRGEGTAGFLVGLPRVGLPRVFLITMLLSFFNDRIVRLRTFSSQIILSFSGSVGHNSAREPGSGSGRVIRGLLKEFKAWKCFGTVRYAAILDIDTSLGDFLVFE